MAKPKAPAWLRDAFRHGVDAYEGGAEGQPRIHRTPAYVGAHGFCWLAQFDPAKRPCSPGPLERFHFCRRQDVETAMWQQLRGALYEEPIPYCYRTGGVGAYRIPLSQAESDELILIAAWDPRNGGLGCEQHHRRYDGHQVSLPREQLVVPYSALPSRVIQFGFDYSEGRLLDRFPSDI